MRRLLALLFVVLMAMPAFAVNPDEVLQDPALEARAREISAHLRCLVCQNQSIDDSNADLAKDLRLLVRDRLKEGETNEQVIDYIVSRYGEFVLLKPRFEKQTLILWGMPVFLGLIALTVVLIFILRRSKAAKGRVLSDDEKAELDRILKS